MSVQITGLTVELVEIFGLLSLSKFHHVSIFGKFLSGTYFTLDILLILRFPKHCGWIYQDITYCPIFSVKISEHTEALEVDPSGFY